MGSTRFDNINAIGANAKVVTNLPSTPAAYFGADTNDVDSVEWRGGELAFQTITTYSGRLYIQVNTSGKTAAWTRLLETLATTTSTSSTSTTTSTSTSTSTSSSTSSSTSTSTSTSSSTSTSTSTSSTTTGGG